jgi:hypothetical protein
MLRSVHWLTLLLVLAACRESRSGTGGAGAPAVATRTGGADELEPGVEFEAPRLIPGIRAQISEIRDQPGASRDLAAFKGGVGNLVTAMEADLNRVGVAAGGSFSALSDSILREIGGGAGDPPDLSPEAARQLTPRVERLIGIYEERMREAAS